MRGDCLCRFSRSYSCASTLIGEALTLGPQASGSTVAYSRFFAWGIHSLLNRWYASYGYVRKRSLRRLGGQSRATAGPIVRGSPWLRFCSLMLPPWLNGEGGVKVVIQ